MIARLAVLLFLGGLGARLHAQTEDYAIDWHSLNCGGGTSTDEVYSVSGTIGQFDAGEIGDEVDSVFGGFWAAALVPETPGVPVLSIALAGSNLILSWSAAAGFSLEENADLFQTDGWHPVTQPVLEVNGQNTVIIPASERMSYYRLTESPSLPRLTILLSGANVILAWPASVTGYFLEQNLDVTQLDGWLLVGVPVVVSNAQNTVTLPVANGMAFFRLTQTPSRPALTIVQADNNVILAWPASATGYLLEQNFDATRPDGWSLVGFPVVVSNAQNTVTLPVTNGMAFFRLTQTPSRPALTIGPADDNVILSWPASAAGYFLEQNFDVTQPDSWSPVNLPVEVINDRNTVTVPASDCMAYYRLTESPSLP